MDQAGCLDGCLPRARATCNVRPIALFPFQKRFRSGLFEYAQGRASPRGAARAKGRPRTRSAHLPPLGRRSSCSRKTAVRDRPCRTPARDSACVTAGVVDIVQIARRINTPMAPIPLIASISKWNQLRCCHSSFEQLVRLESASVSLRPNFLEPRWIETCGLAKHEMKEKGQRGGLDRAFVSAIGWRW